MRKLFSKLAMLSLVLLVVFPQSAGALSSAQKQAFDSGIYYFDTESDQNCSVDVGATLSGNDQIQQAYNYYVQQGLTPAQSAGLVGNLWWESGLIPTKVNGGSTSDTPVPGKAWGIAQWTGGRVTALQVFGQQNNENIDDLLTQLQFSWSELNGSEQKAGNDLKAQVTVDDAAQSVFTYYEAPGDKTLPNRQARAEAVYNLYGSSAGGTTVSAPASGDGCSSTGPGQDTQYINGFTVYSQCDPQWKDNAYGSGDTSTYGCTTASNTIGTNGCGPTAMAMIITALTGQQVTPDLTAAYATSQGLYESGVGSSWSIAPKLAAHWGLNSKPVGADVAGITAVLQNGGLVIAAGSGALPFTSGGHFIVIRGVTTDGQWQIGDPGNSSTSSQQWDPAQLVSTISAGGSGGSVYAITKQ